MIRLGDYVKVRMSDGYRYGCIENIIPMNKRDTELEADYRRVRIRSGKDTIDVAEDQVEPLA